MDDYELIEYQLPEDVMEKLQELAEAAKVAIEEQKDKFNIQGYYDQINDTWKQLGDRFGFDWTTTKESSRGGLYFLAAPLQMMVGNEKTEEEAVSVFIGTGIYVPAEYKKALQPLIENLPERCYSSLERKFLEVDPAFIALKHLCASEVQPTNNFKSLLIPMALKRALNMIISSLENGFYTSSVHKTLLVDDPLFLDLKNISNSKLP